MEFSKEWVQETKERFAAMLPHELTDWLAGSDSQVAIFKEELVSRKRELQRARKSPTGMYQSGSTVKSLEMDIASMERMIRKYAREAKLASSSEGHIFDPETLIHGVLAVEAYGMIAKPMRERVKTFPNDMIRQVMWDTQRIVIQRKHALGGNSKYYPELKEMTPAEYKHALSTNPKYEQLRPLVALLGEVVPLYRALGLEIKARNAAAKQVARG